MRAVFCPEEGKPEIIEIENELRAIQMKIGGYIETYMFSDAVILCDEDGIIKGLPRNKSCLIPGFTGNVLIVGNKGDEFCSLTEANAKMIHAKCMQRYDPR